MALQLGTDDVAGAIGEVVLAEGLRVLVDHTVIEQPDRLSGAIVINDHLLAADDDGAAQLAGRQPAELDVRHDARREVQRDEGDVVDALDD